MSSARVEMFANTGRSASPVLDEIAVALSCDRCGENLVLSAACLIPAREAEALTAQLAPRTAAKRTGATTGRLGGTGGPARDVDRGDAKREAQAALSARVTAGTSAERPGAAREAQAALSARVTAGTSAERPGATNAMLGGPARDDRHGDGEGEGLRSGTIARSARAIAGGARSPVAPSLWLSVPAELFLSARRVAEGRREERVALCRWEDDGGWPR